MVLTILIESLTHFSPQSSIPVPIAKKTVTGKSIHNPQGNLKLKSDLTIS